MERKRQSDGETQLKKVLRRTASGTFRIDPTTEEDDDFPEAILETEVASSTRMSLLESTTRDDYDEIQHNLFFLDKGDPADDDFEIAIQNDPSEAEPSQNVDVLQNNDEEKDVQQRAEVAAYNNNNVQSPMEPAESPSNAPQTPLNIGANPPSPAVTNDDIFATPTFGTLAQQLNAPDRAPKVCRLEQGRMIIAVPCSDPAVCSPSPHRGIKEVTLDTISDVVAPDVAKRVLDSGPPLYLPEVSVNKARKCEPTVLDRFRRKVPLASVHYCGETRLAGKLFFVVFEDDWRKTPVRGELLAKWRPRDLLRYYENSMLEGQRPSESEDILS